MQLYVHNFICFSYIFHWVSLFIFIRYLLRGSLLHLVYLIWIKMLQLWYKITVPHNSEIPGSLSLISSISPSLSPPSLSIHTLSSFLYFITHTSMISKYGKEWGWCLIMSNTSTLLLQDNTRVQIPCVFSDGQTRNVRKEEKE